MNKKEAKQLIEKHPQVAASIIVASAKFLNAFDKRVFSMTKKMAVEEALGKGCITAYNAMLKAMEAVPVDDPTPQQSETPSPGTASLEELLPQ